MAKQTLSVTLEPQTIENIRKMAAEELRTMSNMIEYIVAEYMLEKRESNSVKHARAAVFGEQVAVSNFTDTKEMLKKNIHIDEADAVFLGKR